MIHVLLLIIYIAMILAVIFIERKSPTEALLWVLVLVCLPYAGAILYLVFGSTLSIKLTSYMRNRRMKKQLAIFSRPLPAPVCREVLSEEDNQVIHFNYTYNGSNLTDAGETSIFTNGKSHYKSLFRDLKLARECIYMEFYTIHNDMVGRALAKLLEKKARQGVTVIVICDFIANISTPYGMFRPLMKAGGTVLRAKPYPTHYRNHRKVVAIDHEISYIGGMNIGKQYANLHKVKTPWRDTQIRMEGSCTIELEDYFLKDYLCTVHKKHWKSAVGYLETIKRPSYEETGQPCQFIEGGVDNNKESIKMCYLSMIRCAKRSIRIQSPYFIPDTSILNALKTAAATGIKIELMIPGVKSSFFLEPVTRYYTGQLLEYNATVYRYSGYIHAKTMVVDDEMCCIGSVNMDIRSFRIDDEVCGIFYGNDLVREYSDIYDDDIESCTPYTWEEFQDRPVNERLAESIFLPFAPLM